MKLQIIIDTNNTETTISADFNVFTEARFRQTFPFIVYSILKIAWYIPYCNDMHFFLFLYQTVDNTIIFDK